MEIYLMRHPTVKTEKGICYGQKEIPLSDQYTQELDDLRAPVQWDKIGRWYASPLPRCRKAVEHISETSAIQYDDRLMELDFGAWEGKRWDSIDKQQLDRWMKNFYEEPVPDGESYQELETRAIAFWDECSQHEESTLVMTHAGVIRAILGYLLNLSPKNVFSLHLDYSRVTAINPAALSPIQYINHS